METEQLALGPYIRTTRPGPAIDFEEMMRSLPVALTAVALATACASVSERAFDVVNGDYTKATNDQLCAVYGFRANGADKARNELIRRGVFSGSDWANIDARKLAIGMPECAVAAAAFVHYARVEGGQHNGSAFRNYIYSCNSAPVPHCPFTQITIQNGVVTSVAPRSVL